MYSIVLAFSGVILLITGIFTMRYGLQRLLWHRLQHILSSLTGTVWRGLLVGTVAAAIMQSSTAVSLITIGLVSAEYLSFNQGLGIILGANIGTCTTVQLLSLSLPDQYFLPMLVISLLIAVSLRKLRFHALATAGLLSMFIGLSILSDALGTLPQFDTVLKYLIAAKQNPLYGILGGMIITLLFQSSSAATGVLMVLATDGIIDIFTASYVVYGNNIGSCLSSVVVGAAAPLAAKRVAVSHIVLNVIGVMVFLPFTSTLTNFASQITPDFAGQIAAVHTIFNIVSSIVVVPFTRQFSRFITFLVPE